MGRWNGPMLDGHLLELFITLPLRCPSRICLIKTLLEKNPLGKNSSEGKRVQHPFTSYIYFSPSTIQPSLRRRRLIFCTHCSKVLLGSDFVKSSAKLPHERICWLCDSSLLALKFLHHFIRSSWMIVLPLVMNK